MREPVLAVRGVSKRYGRVQALSDVSLDLHAGEVHALVGENGAGKTTLERIIAGEQPRDAGDVLLDGQPVTFKSPAEARRHGIAVVHQDFPMVPAMTVAENLFLGEPELSLRLGGTGLLARRRMRALAAETLRPFGLEHTVARPIRTFGVAEHQLIEIARATAREARVLILDEPTSSLDPAETDAFFTHLERVRGAGTAVAFISHRINEVMRIADRVSALRDGRLVHSAPASELDADRVVRLIAGRVAGHVRTREAGTTAEPLLSARVHRPDGEGRWEIDVREGEIVGVAGLLGSGARELLATLAGQVRRRGDKIVLAGTDLSHASMPQRIAAGLCLLPGDHGRSLALHLSIENNVLLPNFRRFRHGPVIRRSKLRSTVDGLIQELRIRPADGRTRVGTLSGGNKQKVAIAKWLASSATVILMDDPFRGVDVGAKDEFAAVIDRFVRDGGGVLLHSSDMRELTALADRIVVMRDGQTVAQFDAGAFDDEAIMASAVGTAR